MFVKRPGVLFYLYWHNNFQIKQIFTYEKLIPFLKHQEIDLKLFKIDRSQTWLSYYSYNSIEIFEINKYSDCFGFSDESQHKIAQFLGYPGDLRKMGQFRFSVLTAELMIERFK